MAKKEPIIKTKRLILQPMSNEEIKNLSETALEEELKIAYGEMLSGCEADPKNRIWYAPWKILLKEEKIHIGELGFRGPVTESAVEIGYGILKEYEGNGYTTEAVKALTDWAFGNENIYFVEAETAPDNKASQRILEKLEFVPDGEGEEGPRFVKEKEETNWMAIYMSLGVAVGISFGSALDNVGIGLSLGICFGLCIGTGLNASMKKEREKIRENRLKKHYL